MRHFLLSLGAWLCLGTAAAFSAETFPHYAYIANELVDIWSGPSSDYYVTGRLTQGTRVEVHRRDAGSWLAIRPPENSFSWVPAQKILMTDETTIGEIISDDAFAWVGSVVTPVAEHRWQVKLHRGERVEILGEKRVTDETTGVTATWYRIAPPSGEFRWVRDQDVSSEAVDATDALDRPPRVIREADYVDRQVQSAGWTDRTSRSQVPDPRNSNERKQAVATGEKNVPTREPDNVRQLDLAVAPRKDAANSAGAKFPDLAELEAELSLIVAKEPAQWNLLDLRQRVQELVDRGQTPLERGRARLLLEKVDQFEALRRRQVQVEQSIAVREDRMAAGDSTGRSVGSSGGPGGARVASTSPKPRYDGAGWLMSVERNRRDVPAFALTDDDGYPLQYVVPAPGVNLNRYLKTRVGIYGQRNPSKSVNNTPIITAQRVVDLDRK